ncbi:hypothetical protein RIF29_25311 [Crotalaria pallida]|uniref:Uncharacterized protein n=1 Tax=Crotalaria pallida TaxID=3830 RepID=A0AAN9ETJ2_CROPI
MIRVRCRSSGEEDTKGIRDTQLEIAFGEDNDGETLRSLEYFSRWNESHSSPGLEPFVKTTVKPTWSRSCTPVCFRLGWVDDRGDVDVPVLKDREDVGSLVQPDDDERIDDAEEYPELEGVPVEDGDED